MIRETVNALVACVLTFLVCAVAYPLVVLAAASLLFPDQARGSLIRREGRVVGSALVAQPFASETYFAPRPSAAGASGYAADAAGGSNLATTNPALRERIEAQVKTLRQAAGDSATEPIPADLVTASGSGLDPDISPEAARYQAPRVARARGIAVEKIRALIDAHVDATGAIIGAPPRVNVLRLNLALDDLAAAR
ncbi:potassium-transporting ATPase subunit KdpC [Aquisphaera insulae]|uniref:potassium-transporting ATPase subunit KdpC n=1 Tax=Aquisphaera insulae TaxID=2712864 RepID=UPI0013EDC50B|nr:potassium-transporting ATPase subunit KdpC [Aquisphaera insulae]